MELTHLSLEWILAGGASVLLYAIFLTWFLANRFNLQEKSFIKKMDELYNKLIEKLEYHERHDDARFSAIQQDIQSRATSVMNDIWTLKLQQASTNAKKELEDCRK